MFDIEITDFWKWFEDQLGGFDSTPIDKNLLEELDHIIVNWGLTWEIGPGLSKKHSLTISPGGSKNLLEQANCIINQAPVLDDWEFTITLIVVI